MGFGSDLEQRGPPPCGLNSLHIPVPWGFFGGTWLSIKHRDVSRGGPSEFTSVWLFCLVLGLEVQLRSRAADVALLQVQQILPFQRRGVKGGDSCGLVYLPAQLPSEASWCNPAHARVPRLYLLP